MKDTVKFIRPAGMRHIEARFSRYTQSIFKKHAHDTYAIGVIEQGESSFLFENTTRHAHAGDIVLLNPGDVHACNPAAGTEWVYQMFYVEPELMRQIAGEVFDMAEGVPRFIAEVVQDRELYHALIEMYDVFLESDALLEKDSCVHETLAQLLLAYSNGVPALMQAETCVQPVKIAHDYLLKHLDRNIALEELSAEAGLSPYHLLRVFREQFGLPPHAFQVQQRVNQAKRLLAQGWPIVEVALEVGFSDQSHFSNKFKSLVGATPRQYQQAKR